MMVAFALMLALGSAFGQTFEVASVKVSAPGKEGRSIQSSPGGRFTTENTSLKSLIAFAFDVRDYQLTGGPNWLDSEHYDIVARPENFSENGPQKIIGPQIRAMVRALLAERFKLMVRRETKEGAVYSLVLAKGGSKLKPSAPESRGPGVHTGRGEITATKTDMTFFAKIIAGQVSRPVIDNTGLKDQYDFQLKWTPDMGQPEVAADSDRPSIFTAIQEQLGLKLEPAKGPVEIFVIDHAEKPSDN